MRKKGLTFNWYRRVLADDLDDISQEESEEEISYEENEDNQEKLFQDQDVSMSDDNEAEGNSSNSTKYFYGKSHNKWAKKYTTT